jgi:cell division protease FtsH
MFPRQRRGTFLAILLALLAFNFLLAFVTGNPADRTKVPYEPFFVDQVRAGNVQKITSQEQTIEGQLKKEATFTPPGGDAEKVTKFKTEVPAFVETTELTNLLGEKDVVVNAEAPDTGRSVIGTILLGFGPTILLVALFVWFARRQASGGGVLGGFGSSRARRVTPGETERVTFEDVAGIDEAENELGEIVDFLKNPERYSRLGSRAACCSTARRARARRCSRAPSPARPTPRSSRSRRRSSSRRSSESARPACATSSRRPRRPRRRSSSSTSSTRSGARGRATSAA